MGSKAEAESVARALHAVLYPEEEYNEELRAKLASRLAEVAESLRSPVGETKAAARTALASTSGNGKKKAREVAEHNFQERMDNMEREEYEEEKRVEMKNKQIQQR